MNMGAPERFKKIGIFYTELLPAKLYYFSQHYSFGNYVPFINLYFVSIGLTIGQAGLVNGLRQIFAAAIALLIGFLADYTQKQKFITIFVLILSVLIVVPSPYVMNLFRDQSKASLNVSVDVRNSSDSNINGHSVPPPIPFIIFWFGLVAGLGMSTMSLVERAVIALLKNFNGKASYGMQRIFAPIGYSLGSLLTGIAIDDYVPSYGMSKYTVLFLCLIAPNTTIILSIIKLKMNHKSNSNIEPEKEDYKKESMSIALKKTIFQSKIVIFLFTVLTVGMSMGLMDSYLPLLLEEIESSKTVLGFTVAMSTVSEVFIFPFTARLLKMLGSCYICFSIALFAYSTRFIVYFFAKNIAFVIVSQILHAFSHSLFWVAVYEYTYAEASSIVSQTMFSIINVLFYMIASVIANVSGGWLFELYGGRKMFLYFAILCFVWGILVTMFYGISVRKTERKSKENDILLNEIKKSVAQ